MEIVIQSAPFDPGELLNAFHARAGEVGAVVSFTGIVRGAAEGLTRMEIEHYPAMTEVAIGKIATEAQTRWQLDDVLVVHRHGSLRPGEVIMMVATGARHRVAAFEAAEFLMDYLKSRAPFWKKEIGADGAQWVAAREADEEALTRW